MHYTAGRSLESSVAGLTTRKPSGNASAHLVLGRDGRIVQLLPFNVVAWHAGISHWAGVSGLNAHSIGIEMDNAGALTESGGRYFSWFEAEYPAEQVLLAAHRHGGPVRPWHRYTGAQIERALELAELLVAHYRLEEVLGHEDIAPGRKTDPGPAFPLEALRAQVAGREGGELSHWVVTASALNIRRGPGAQFDPVAPPLKKGTQVLLLEAGSRWNRVEVAGATDLEGWVANGFLAPAPSAPPPASRGRSGPARKVTRKAAAKKAAARQR
jgi:N-acetylmuramoyl-L-alanine amidase